MVHMSDALCVNAAYICALSHSHAGHRRPGEPGRPLQQVADVPGLRLPHPALQHPQCLHLHLLPLLVGTGRWRQQGSSTGRHCAIDIKGHLPDAFIQICLQRVCHCTALSTCCASQALT